MNEVYPYMESSIPIWNLVSLYNVDVRTMRRIVQPRQPEASETQCRRSRAKKGLRPRAKKGLRPSIVSTAQSF